jgi:hypothetical protein
VYPLEARDAIVQARGKWSDFRYFGRVHGVAEFNHGHRDTLGGDHAGPRPVVALKARTHLHAAAVNVVHTWQNLTAIRPDIPDLDGVSVGGGGESLDAHAQAGGRNRDADCENIRAFLSANRIPYEWVDRDVYPERVLAGLSDDPDCPGVSVDGQLFSEPPTTREIAAALQLQTKPNHDSYDVVIVGAGPAGMAAGVYGSYEGLTCWLSSVVPQAGKQVHHPASKTIWDFLKGFQGKT